MGGPFDTAWSLIKDDQTMAMFEQVQAAKRARQQQMIDAGLNPMTGTMQTQPMGGVPSTGALGAGNSPPQMCPTCGGAGQV